MNETQGIDAFTRILGNFGLPMAMVACAVWLGMRYGPRLADAHLQFMETSEKSIKSSNHLMRRMQTDLRSKALSHSLTHEAMKEASFACEKLAHGTTKEDEIKEHCRAIRKLLADAPREMADEVEQ